MQVPFLDLKAQHAPLEEELTAAFRTIVRGAAFVGGPEVEAFEREFAAFCHVPGAVGVSSGTDALRFAYLAMGVKPGDEVITVPNSFIATTEALTQAGAAVRFVDVLPDTLLMDPTKLAAAITPRTVGIVPVHLYGTPADMDPIQEIARAHGLWVVEDAAQAQGAVYMGRRAGTMGEMAAFSFYPGKNLGACGEAGAVTSADAGRLEFVRKLREHGQAQKYYHDIEGYNGRLDALQAAFLRIKLRRLEQWNQARRALAALYRQRLSEAADVRIVAETPGSRSVYHLFVVRVPERDRRGPPRGPGGPPAGRVPAFAPGRRVVSRDGAGGGGDPQPADVSRDAVRPGRVRLRHAARVLRWAAEPLGGAGDDTAHAGVTATAPQLAVAEQGREELPGVSGVPDPYYVSVAYSHEPTDPRIRRHCEAMARRGWRVVHIGLAGPGESRVGRLNGVVLLRWSRRRYRGAGLLRYGWSYLQFSGSGGWLPG